METEKKKCRGTAPKLIFSCMGAAGVGELCDQAARALSRLVVGSMYFLAGIGGAVELMKINAHAAHVCLVLDGCPTDCGLKTMQHANIDNVPHLRLSDTGFPKGNSPATAENINHIVEHACPMLEG